MKTSRPLTRRRFCQAAAAFAILGGRASAQAARARIKFAVIGINHEHVFRMVKAVRGGGGELAMVFAAGMDPNHGGRFLRENAGVAVAREEREVLEARDIQLIVTAARPAERAAVGMRAMRAGKDVLADKGGFLNLESLAEARRVQAETKRIYSISYNERLLLPVSLKIDVLLRAGAIGRVTHMQGWGPHGLFGHGPREDYFWTRSGKGGILADIGAHQCDQFLHYTGSKTAEVTGAFAGNFQNPDHPEFEDFGEVWLKGDGGTGQAQLWFYSDKSSGFLLALHGTEGRMLVQKQAGRIVVTRHDGKSEEHMAKKGVELPFGRQLVDDVVNRTETAMTQAHAFLASELAVRAQMAAVAGRR